MSFTKIPKLFAALSDETIMNFKKLSLVLFGTFFSLSSFASEMSDVSQSVMPIDPRCNISVGDSAIDFGMLSRGQLQRDNQTFSPGTRVLMLNVVCPDAQLIKMIAQGLSDESGNIRYGTAGRLKLKLSDAWLDGRSVALIDVTDDRNTPQSQISLKAGTRFSAWVNGAAAMGKNFQAKLEIVPVMEDRAARVRQITTSNAYFSIEMNK